MKDYRNDDGDSFSTIKSLLDNLKESKNPPEFDLVSTLTQSEGPYYMCANRNESLSNVIILKDRGELDKVAKIMSEHPNWNVSYYEKNSSIEGVTRMDELTQKSSVMPALHYNLLFLSGEREADYGIYFESSHFYCYEINYPGQQGEVFSSRVFVDFETFQKSGHTLGNVCKHVGDSLDYN